MRLFIAFMLLFVVIGMSSRSLGAWGYFFIAVAASALAGTYMISGGVW
ncbi:MAG TPA: hypothetical protein VIH21_10690 [Dehalococcoidia bacterium]|jgi:hypothetical protein